MVQTTADKFRKVEFREKARDIVKIDRERRKYGMTVDTAGSIARAMENAYQRGRQEEREGQPDIPPQNGELCINWYLIPPRPRNAFWSICLNLLGKSIPFMQHDGGLKLVSIRNNERLRWVLLKNWENEDSVDQLNTWGPQTINPLVKLGLLHEENKNQIVLTAKGILTWRRALSIVDYECINLAN